MKSQIFSKDFSSVCNANYSSLIVNKDFFVDHLSRELFLMIRGVFRTKSNI